MIQQYKVIGPLAENKLMETMKHYLKNGWLPLGPALPNPHYVGQLYQTVIKMKELE